MSLTAEQIELRKQGVGGSEQGVIAGVSARMTALELYFRKRDEWIPDKDTDPFFADMGHAAEGPLAAWVERETGEKLYTQRRTKYHRNPALRFLLGHSDRLVQGARHGWEFKMRASGAGWGPSGSVYVPADVHLQCDHYMALHKAPCWKIAVLISGRDRRIYEIPRDRAREDELIDRASEFWARVKLGTPPELDCEHRTAVQVLHTLYPGANGAWIELPQEAEEWAKALVLARKRKRELGFMEDAARARLEELMGPASVGQLPSRATLTRSVRRNAGGGQSLYFTYKESPK